MKREIINQDVKGTPFAEAMDRITANIKAIEIPNIEIPNIEIPKITTPITGSLNKQLETLVESINKSTEPLRKAFERWHEYEQIRYEKGRKNFDKVKDEYCTPGSSFIEIVPKDYDQFFEWYEQYILRNEAYWDLPGYVPFGDFDEVTKYIDEYNRQEVKVIGVCSVSFALYSEYRIKQHKAQRNGDKWTHWDEMARMRDFIIVGRIQVEQVQDPKEEIKEKIEKKFNEEYNEKTAKDAFFKENDYHAFIDALALHLQGKEFIMPTEIEIRPNNKDRVAKAIYRIIYEYPEFKDNLFMDLVKKLSIFKNDIDEQINTALRRTRP